MTDTTTAERDELIARLVEKIPASATTVQLVRVRSEVDFEVLVTATAETNDSQDASDAIAGMVAFFAANDLIDFGNDGVLAVLDHAEGTPLLSIPLTAESVDKLSAAYDALAVDDQDDEDNLPTAA